MYEKDTKILEQLRLGQQEALAELYQQYRDAFLAYSNRFPLDESIRLDAWQDALVALYDNVQSGRLETLKSSLKTYLFSIGKYVLMNEIRRQEKLFQPPEDEYDFSRLPAFRLDEDSHDLEMQSAFERLGGRCQELLTYFYYQNYSVEAIAARMNYANENTVSAHKSRCLKQLRKLLKP